MNSDPSGSVQDHDPVLKRIRLRWMVPYWIILSASAALLNPMSMTGGYLLRLVTALSGYVLDYTAIVALPCLVILIRSRRPRETTCFALATAGYTIWVCLAGDLFFHGDNRFLSWIPSLALSAGARLATNYPANWLQTAFFLLNSFAVILSLLHAYVLLMDLRPGFKVLTDAAEQPEVSNGFKSQWLFAAVLAAPLLVLVPAMTIKPGMTGPEVYLSLLAAGILCSLDVLIFPVTIKSFHRNSLLPGMAAFVSIFGLTIRAGVLWLAKMAGITQMDIVGNGTLPVTCVFQFLMMLSALYCYQLLRKPGGMSGVTATNLINPKKLSGKELEITT